MLLLLDTRSFLTSSSEEYSNDEDNDIHNSRCFLPSSQKPFQSSKLTLETLITFLALIYKTLLIKITSTKKY